MAVSTSFMQLSRRLKLRAKGFSKNAEIAIRKAAIAADSAVVMKTPVDTGRARAGWLATVGSPSGSSPLATDQDGGPTMTAAQSVIGNWKLGAGPIFLTNNVVYIEALDNGSSIQAPQGMSSAGIQAAQFQLRKVKLLGGV